MHGWIPTTVQVIAAVAVIAAVSSAERTLAGVWMPWALVVGAALTASAYWYVASEGLAGDDPAPRPTVDLDRTDRRRRRRFWWRAGAARWWRRGVSVSALPLCLLCAALALNLWVGYFPTVQTAWNQLTAGPLPDQTDQVTVAAMQKQRKIPPKGTVVPVDISDTASGFRHRGELVYLPPAWYATNPPPRLPTVMMIGGEFNTPADWLRAGNAVKTVDDFAAAHGGNAPVLVFVDSGGAFNNDTECVNGTRGNAADHLTKDVVPYMISHFGVSADRSNWGVVGWSMGGTCAVDLTVMHPDMFSAFEDIAGDLGPNSGTKAADHRPAVRRQRRRVGGVRPDDGDHPPRPVHRSRRAGSTSTARTPAIREHQERPGRSGEFTVRAGHRQRHQVRGGQPARQA